MALRSLAARGCGQSCPRGRRGVAIRPRHRRDLGRHRCDPDPQLLARMAHQAAEAEVAAGEATEPELAPALARARALGRLPPVSVPLAAALFFSCDAEGYVPAVVQAMLMEAYGGHQALNAAHTLASEVRRMWEEGARTAPAQRAGRRRRRGARASPRAEAPGVQRDTASVTEGSPASPPSANPVRRVPSAAAWRALDDVDLATEFRHPVATLQDVPGFLRSALRAALVQALRQVRAAHDAPRAGDPAACARAWKLFVLAPRMLLARVGQKGPEGRQALLDRVVAFQRGDWLALLRAARGSAANSRAVAGGEADDERRSARGKSRARGSSSLLRSLRPALRRLGRRSPTPSVGPLSHETICPAT